MNILTYATQVGIKPTPVYAVSLYKNTLSHENFMRNRWGVLQLLPPAADVTIPLLGKESGRAVDKMARLREIGVHLTPVHANVRATTVTAAADAGDADDADDSLLVMTDSPMLLLAEIVDGPTSVPVDVGDHDVVFCEIRRVISINAGNEGSAAEGAKPYLTTKMLRDKGLL